MNPLLLRQLRKHLPAFNADAEPWQAFLAVVSTAYDDMQKDRDLLEHTLEVTSDELTEANEKLRREAENRLQSLSRYYQQTLELQQGMILCFKKTARGFEHTLCRGQLAGRLGWSPERVEGKALVDFLPHAQAETLQAAYVRAWAGEECACEGTSIDGRLFYLAQLRPRREAGEVCEVIVSCVEITALKNFERELRAAKERAESADRAKGQFLAVMSHEIRTPLNAILGFSQLLHDSENMTAEQKDWLASIETSGDLLRELIDDILDYSKIEAGKLELNEQLVELEKLLESVVATFRTRAAQKQIDLRLALAPGLPALVFTDGMRLRQILVNLVSNAIKFTRQGRVTLAAAVVAPAEMPAGPGWILRFEVSDTGVGIDPAHRERMFKPFSQADSSTTRTFGGTGLGLAICKRLAMALGGDIDYKSEPGRGSAFFFAIFARSGEAKQVAKKAPAPAVSG